MGRLSIEPLKNAEVWPSSQQHSEGPKATSYRMRYSQFINVSVSVIRYLHIAHVESKIIGRQSGKQLEI